MTDIEPKEVFRQKAIDLINEYRQQRGNSPIDFLPINTPEISAFIRSIQLHEKTKQELADFKQEVSDAVEEYYSKPYDFPAIFQSFIIPKPKPDPLLAALLELELSSDLQEGQHDAKWIRNKLDALGFEIREKNDD
jgi:hypothetical protein